MAHCKISFIGNLGRDPEMRYTPSGTPVTEFSVAVNLSKKDKNDEWVDKTEWFRVTVWGQQGERMAERLRKGHRVLVEGRFETREYEDRNHVDRTSLEVTADTCISLDKHEEEEGGFGRQKPQGGTRRAEPRDDLDDLPF